MEMHHIAKIEKVLLKEKLSVSYLNGMKQLFFLSTLQKSK